MAPTPRLPDEHGIIYDRPDLRLVDTRTMVWEDFPGLKGCKVKVLSRFPDGHAMIFLVWMPPGSPIPTELLPHRHVHRTTSEFAYVLSGELPHWEYEDASQKEGELVVFKEGYFMHRKPGSLHGLEPGPVSDTGCLILFWRDGVGNWLDDPNAAEESPEVPYPA